jgi:hypothetical protein
MTNRERARRACLYRYSDVDYVRAHKSDCPQCAVFERALAEARAEEREACADLVRERALEGDYSPRSELSRAAAAIRNRGGE